jgi:ethanolamine utilization microcompartment shell protein EutS
MNEVHETVRMGNRWLPGAAFTLVCLLFAMDSAMKLLQLRPAVEANAALGFNATETLIIGGILAICLTLYVIPISRFTGALLLTGYLGGAVAIHFRARSSLFEILFPVFVGFLLWGALLWLSPEARGLPWLRRLN